MTISAHTVLADGEPKISQGESCNIINIDDNCTSYGFPLYAGGVGWKSQSDPCNWVYIYGDPAEPIHTLYKEDQNGNWNLVSGPDFHIHQYTVATGGRYKVVSECPVPVNSKCDKPYGSYTNVLDVQGRLLGYLGTYAGVSYTSNTITVGSPSTNYISGQILGDGPPGPVYQLQNANDYSGAPTNVWLDLNGTDFTYPWALYVWEDNNPSRTDRWAPSLMDPGAWGPGWHTSNNPPQGNQYDISQVWLGNGFTFLPYHQYHVQFSLGGGCGTGWYEKDFPFFVCNEGNTGCQITSGYITNEIKVSPNPAISTFSLTNLIMTPGQEYHMVLTDMSGRQVMRYTNLSAQTYDISALSNGLYTVTVWRGAEKIQTAKLNVTNNN